MAPDSTAERSRRYRAKRKQQAAGADEELASLRRFKQSVDDQLAARAQLEAMQSRCTRAGARCIELTCVFAGLHSPEDGSVGKPWVHRRQQHV